MFTRLASEELPVAQESVGLDWGFTAALVGILVVFCVLVLIIVLVKCMSGFAKNLDNSQKKKEESKLAAQAAAKPVEQPKSEPVVQAAPEPAPAQNDEGELIAVISAAVATVMGDAQFKISSYKKLKRVSNWGKAGRDDELFNKLY